MSDTEIKTFETLWKMIWGFLYELFEKLGWSRISKETSEYWEAE